MQINLCLNANHFHLFRSIKRKKFDDELVESSLVKSSTRVKGPPVIEPIRCSGSEPSSNEKKKVMETMLENIKLHFKDERSEHFD